MAISKTLKSIGHNINISLRKNSPKIFVISGVVGMVTGTILACKATLKAHDILEKGREKEENLKEDKALGLITEDEYKKESTKNKVTTVGKVVGTYAPAAAVMTLSGASVLKGLDISIEREATTGAALIEATDRANKLIERIEEKEGAKAKDEILYDIKNEKVDETVKDPETGKEKTRKVTKTVMGEDLSNTVAIRLSRANWTEKTNIFDYDISALKLYQESANGALKDRALFGGKSVYFMVEFLQAINYKPAFDSEFIKQHHNAGWVWSSEHPMSIDIGLTEAERLKDFSIVDEDEILLHLNCVPNVWAYQ